MEDRKQTEGKAPSKIETMFQNVVSEVKGTSKSTKVVVGGGGILLSTATFFLGRLTKKGKSQSPKTSE